MPGDPTKGNPGPRADAPEDDDDDRDEKDSKERPISDFVRRAVSAGIEAAGRSKEDLVRVATSEIRDWLNRLELDTELRKTLSKMVLEVKAEIRFRPTEDGKLEPEADVKVRSGGKP